MNFSDFDTQNRRLAVLQALQHSVQYRANALLLRTYCHSLAYTVSVDRMEADIAWLAEQGLVTKEQAGAITVAVLTPRGLDVATGVAQVPGVQRPLPGA